MYFPARCNLNPDIAFAVGLSSVKSSQFSRLRNFITLIAKRFKISPNNAQASVVQFSDTADLSIKLNASPSWRYFASFVNRLRYTGEGKRVDSGLRTAYDQAFSAKNGMRITSQQVLVLVTDMEQDDQSLLQPALRLFTEAGIHVIAVSLKDQVIPSNLMQVGIDVLKPKSLDDLTSVKFIDDVTQLICHSAGNFDLFPAE